MKTPNPYRPDQSAALAKIEKQRRRLGMSQDGLAHAAGLSVRQWQRIRRSKRAFRRTIQALTFALRTEQKKQTARAQMFAPIGETA